MEYYFDDNENRDKLKAVLKSWKRTPYLHMCGEKGLGCDCIHLVLRVYQEMGIVPEDYKIPNYNADWHLHNKESLLAKGVITSLNDRAEILVGLKDYRPKDGDVILYHYGKTISHAGIYCDRKVYQALHGAGVLAIDYSDKTWKKRARVAIRMKA